MKANTSIDREIIKAAVVLDSWIEQHPDLFNEEQTGAIRFVKDQLIRMDLGVEQMKESEHDRKRKKKRKKKRKAKKSTADLYPVKKRNRKFKEITEEELKAGLIECIDFHRVNPAAYPLKFVPKRSNERFPDMNWTDRVIDEFTKAAIVYHCWLQLPKNPEVDKKALVALCLKNNVDYKWYSLKEYLAFAKFIFEKEVTPEGDAVYKIKFPCLTYLFTVFGCNILYNLNNIKCGRNKAHRRLPAKVAFFCANHPDVLKDFPSDNDIEFIKNYTLF